MSRSPHHSIHSAYALFPKKLRWLFIGHLFRNAATQIAGLFIPIFLYKTAQHLPGISLFPWLSQLSSLQRGILFVAAYYVVYRLVAFFFTIPIAFTIKNIGLVKSLILGNVLHILSYASLFLMSKSLVFVVPAAIFGGLEVVIYWVSYYTEFTIEAEIKKIGQDVGAIAFLEQLVQVALPFIGGVIIGLFGFSAVYVVSIVFLMLACASLALLPEVKLSFVVKWEDLKEWIGAQKNTKMILALGGRHLDFLAFEVWSIYVLLFVGSVQRVGYMYSLVAFLSLVIAYLVGWYLGKHRGKIMFCCCGILLSIVWILRIFVSSIWHLIAIDLTDRLVVTAYVPIFDALFLESSRNKRVFFTYVFREMILSVIEIIFWMMMILLFLSPIQWIGMFMLASIGTLCSLGMSAQRNP